jgi:hypothetical protein
MFCYVSLKDRGLAKAYLVIILMMGANLEVNSKFLATVGEEPSPASDSCSFGILEDFLVVGFFGGIVPTTEDVQLRLAYKVILDPNLHVRWKQQN